MHHISVFALSVLLLGIQAYPQGVAAAEDTGNDIIEHLNSNAQHYLTMTNHALNGATTQLIAQYRAVTATEQAHETEPQPQDAFSDVVQYAIEAAKHSRILEERRFLFALMSHVGDFTTAQKSSIASILNEQVNIDNKFDSDDSGYDPVVSGIVDADNEYLAAILQEAVGTFLQAE